MIIDDGKIAVSHIAFNGSVAKSVYEKESQIAATFAECLNIPVSGNGPEG